MNESLSARLRSLGVKTGLKDLPAPQIKPPDIDSLVNGHLIESEFGRIFCAETRQGLCYTHGDVPMTVSPITARFLRWADSAGGINLTDLYSVAFIDTETTGLAGGTGTLPFMIGIGRFTENGFITSQLFARNPAEERAQLDVFEKIMAGVTTIVSYNGKAFDAPILNTRFTMNGMPSPLIDLTHIDLLPLSRRFWRRRLDSRGLKDIEYEILHYTRDQLDVPGWEIPVLYFNYLRTGDPNPLVGVFYHNVIDIESLAALFLYFNDLSAEPGSKKQLHPIDSFSMAVQIETAGEIDVAVELYEQLLLEELPDYIRPELQLRYARILKRRGDFTRTVNVLNSGSNSNDIEIMIQLAKVLEHQQRDYATALEWTMNALDALQKTISSGSFPENRSKIEDLTRRRDRLKKKIAKENQHDGV